MFAVIKTGGKQYKVQEGDILDIEKIGQDEGKKVTFDEVLLVDSDGKAMIGTPYVANALVSASVVENRKGDKVLIFKKKRRKQYRRTRGHRQQLTRIKIEKITIGAKKEKTAEKKPEETAKAAPKKVAEKKPAAAAKPAPKKAPAKKAPAKKAPVAAAKKPAAKPEANAKPKAKTAAKPKAKVASKATTAKEKKE